MTEKLKAIFNLKNDPLVNLTVRISSNTGAIFEQTFSNNQITVGQMKSLAMKSLLDANSADKVEQYKLISMESKRTLDDQKTLKEEKIKDGDEYFLAKKISNESIRVQQASKSSSIDENLIKERTNDLPSPSIPVRNPPRAAEFRTDLTRILLSLIESSQKLLWYRSDAEQIFQHVERILSRSVTTSNEIEINSNQLRTLLDLGFTEQQARFALKRTKSDLNSAIDLLFTDPKIVDEQEEEIPLSSYSHQGPYISFRQFREKYFQPNPSTVHSLEEMGFTREQILPALQVCRNDQNLACDYLIGDDQQKKAIADAHAHVQRDLDPNSRLFQSLMESPIIQRSINNPQIFFVLLHLYEDPGLITLLLNEPDVGYLLVELSRIYHGERYESNRLNSNSNHVIEMLNENP